MDNNKNKNNINNKNDNNKNNNNDNNTKKENKFDYLFTEEDTGKDVRELNKEEMIKKIQQKIKELKEKEDELHKKFNNGYIPLNNHDMKTFNYQNIINMTMKGNNNKKKANSNQNSPFSKSVNEKINKNENNKDYNEKETMKNKLFNNDNNYNNIKDDDIEIGWMSRMILKMDKYIKYLIQFLNAFLGALFFVAAIYYFTGVHFDAFKTNPNSMNKNITEPPISKHRKATFKKKIQEFKGYSLLMTPDRTSETFHTLNQTITELSNEYNTELFEPHLTLYAPIDLPLQDLKKKIISLSMMDPFELTMNNITIGKKYYQCVLGTIELTSNLQYVHRRTMELLDISNDNYFPHISLIYGDFHNSMKRRILNEILNEKKYTTLLPLKFKISQIEIWKTEGATKTWKCHDTIPFTPEDEDEDEDD